MCTRSHGTSKLWSWSTSRSNRALLAPVFAFCRATVSNPLAGRCIIAWPHHTVLSDSGQTPGLGIRTFPASPRAKLRLMGWGGVKGDEFVCFQLNLASNNIGKLRDDVFAGLLELASLGLANNSIEVLEPAVFADLAIGKVLWFTLLQRFCQFWKHDTAY